MKLILLILISMQVFALEYSKIDLEGCPENSYCKKETGLIRKKWIEHLKDFKNGKISESNLNNMIQQEYGIPISGWAKEEASLQANILMWNSPCKQHNINISKYYIAEIFRKNLFESELKDVSSYFFSKIVVKESDEKISTMVTPRGDAPLFIKDGFYYFLREEDGVFYGVMVNKKGKIKVVNSRSISENPPKEISCPNDLVLTFMRSAPTTSFYQGQYCKEIWDMDSKKYQIVLMGWSCN